MAYRRLGRILWLAVLIAAGALFVYLVRKTGVGLLLAHIQSFGWGFAVLLVLSGTRNLVRTEAWRCTIEGSPDGPGFWQLFGIRLTSAALTDLTLAGPFVGEGARVWITSRYLPASRSLSSIALEDLSYILASGLFVLSGIVLWLLALAPSTEIPGFWIGTVFVLVMLVLLPIALIRRRWMFTSRLIRRLKHKARWRFLERYEHTAREFEESLHGFYETRRKTFLWVLALEMFSQFTGVGEDFWILHAVFGHASFFTAYLVECMYRIVTIMFIFIPLRMGVDAGSTALVMEAVGRTASQGVTLAIIRKVRTIFWVAIGLLLLPHYGPPKEHKLIS